MKELKVQLANALLVVLTVAAIIAAGINFQQQSRYRLPDDGVSWSDRHAGNRKVVEAVIITEGGPGKRAGLKVGDYVLSINGATIESAIAVPQVLARLGAWSKAEYLIERRGVQVKVNVYVGEGVPEPAVYYQYAVGAAYLLIGLFVYLRRGNASKARHFYVLCLTSFVLSTFHYTGKLNNFDKIIYWGNLWAGLFAPTIFLHFCLSFPERRPWLQRSRVFLLYLPASLILSLFLLVGSGSLRMQVSMPDLRWMLDRIWLFAYGFLYLLGALALHLEYRRTEDAIVRQQLKWLRNGVIFGILPFTAFYLLPYAFGVIPGPWMKMAVLSLPLIPLTWAYAIIRYRLMDVDVIFQQGYAYTLATLSVIGLFYMMTLSFNRYDDLTPSAVVVMILIATFAFQPIRNWFQELMDRYLFYKDRYDYRRSLTEFARELNSETDLDHLLDSVIDRLKRTLGIKHVAAFLRSPNEDGFTLARSTHSLDHPTPRRLDLSFLTPELNKPYLFFERTRHALDVVTRELPPSVRSAIAELDFTYYVPCTVRGRIIGYLAVSRTEKGDFLSSDDLDLLQSLAGYLAIAIENARLYQSLERKAEEFERLKEFSENIVESINVGILAADLEDRVESWNAQLERLTGITREQAVGRKLSALLPSGLCERLDQVRGQTGVHHVLKFALPSPANGNGNGLNGHSKPALESIVNLAIAPLVSKDQEQIGRLVIFDDITERSELERQLVQADKLSSIGLLAAGVAHEVNTPLAVISSYAQMLAKQVTGDDAKSRLLDKIAKQTFRASEIVNSLLNFSRVSPTEYVEVDLNRILRETLGLIDHQLRKANIEIAAELAPSLSSVKGNPGKLQQVFLNLFINARDAMEGGGRLTVRSAESDAMARIEVIDTGRGIPPEHVGRIYDPFFTTKAAKKGTGLGLAVTYGIVKEHSGHIEVDSGDGRGTRFLLEFPLVRKPVNA
ncbi:MAG: Adaptive-response sensory-kinase SasA [Bryobacteraceae bacterium]|nr:Adaptive-response sensory-kinase SasA [Bryobacteraceae bacterium]